jgi:hypothetical protein
MPFPLLVEIVKQPLVPSAQTTPTRPEADLVAWVAVAGIGIAIVYFIFFGLWQHRGIGGPSDWAVFGDFLGGVVNPMVGIATVILVVKTLQVTRTEADDTRREMREQTDQLRTQVAHFETQQRLAEIQKRLDGVLAAWNDVMASPAPMVIVGTATGSVELHVHGPIHQLFNRYALTSDLTLLRDSPQFGSSLVDWSNKFNVLVNLLAEMDRYCREYEEVTGNRNLTDYYRHRIQLPLRALMIIDLVDHEVRDRLVVGMNQGIASLEN